MSAEHRKPVAAFVLLMFLAVAVVTIQRADAQGSRLMTAAVGVATESVQGALPTVAEPFPVLGQGRAPALPRLDLRRERRADDAGAEASGTPMTGWTATSAYLPARDADATNPQTVRHRPDGTRPTTTSPGPRPAQQPAPRPDAREPKPRPGGGAGSRPGGTAKTPGSRPGGATDSPSTGPSTGPGSSAGRGRGHEKRADQPRLSVRSSSTTTHSRTSATRRTTERSTGPKACRGKAHGYGNGRAAARR